VKIITPKIEKISVPLPRLNEKEKKHVPEKS
jgi:hypothetical protein